MGKGSKRRNIDKRYCTEEKLNKEFSRIFKKKETKNNEKDRSKKN